MVIDENTLDTGVAFNPRYYLYYFWNNPIVVMEIFAKDYGLIFPEEEKILHGRYNKLKSIANTTLDEFSQSGYDDFYSWLNEVKYKSANLWKVFDRNDGKSINHAVELFNKPDSSSAQETSNTELQSFTSESTCTDGAENLAQVELPKDDEP